MSTDLTLYESVGVIAYREEFMILNVDQGIVDYYRALMPKYLWNHRQRWPAHISVVRHEMAEDQELWRSFEGEQIYFQYSNIVHVGKIYYWLNAFSIQLEEIRLSLGLPVHSQYTIPPEGFKKCFHITLGNFKEYV